MLSHSMFYLILFLLLFISINFLTGTLFCRFFNINQKKITFSEHGLIGIIFLIFFSFFFHFFFPLNIYFNSILIAFIFLLSVKFFKYVKFNFNKRFIIVFIICFFTTLIMSLKVKPHEDFGFYHLPYIINIISDKIIFGLSNIQPQYAWNSSWLKYSAIYNLPFFGTKGVILANSVLYFYILFFFCEKIFHKNYRNKLSEVYVILLSFYIILKFGRITEHGFDFPANIFLLLSFYYFIEIFENEKKNYKNITLFFLFASFCFTIKVSTFIGPFMFLIIFFYFFFIYKLSISKIINTFIFIFLFYFMWILQQIIYSGCALPYLQFTCFDSLSWSTPRISELINGLTGSFNKSYSQYQGNLTPEQYSANYNWVVTWAKRNYIELLEHFSSIIAPILIILLISFSKLKIMFKKKLFYSNILIIYLLSFSLIGLIIWFHKSPVIRFGIAYIFLFVFILLIMSQLIRKILFFNITLVFFICIFFNISKNSIRVFKNNQADYWPIISKTEYKKFSHKDYNINTPINSNVCNDVPYLCTINYSQSIEITRNQGYLTIINLQK